MMDTLQIFVIGWTAIAIFHSWRIMQLENKVKSMGTYLNNVDVLATKCIQGHDE